MAKTASPLQAWLTAGIVSLGLGFGADAWREARQAEWASPPAPLERRAGRIAEGLDASFLAGGFNAVERSVRHDDPAAGDFWRAHGLTPPRRLLDSPAEGVVPLTVQDLALPGYVSGGGGPEEERPPREEIFPPEILALDGRQVALEGFAMPLDYEDGRITVILLSPFPPSCQFGGMLGQDQLIDVPLGPNLRFTWHPFLAVRVTGRLEVGEQLDVLGFVQSLYRLRADRIETLL